MKCVTWAMHLATSPSSYGAVFSMRITLALELPRLVLVSNGGMFMLETAQPAM